MRLPFVQLRQDAMVRARTMARLLGIPAYAGIGLAAELFAWALDMAPEDADGNVDWSGDLGAGDPVALVAAAVGWDGDAGALMAALIRVGFVEGATPRANRNARVRGLDCYEATHLKAQKDRDRKRVQRNSSGRPSDGAGQTQTQTQTQREAFIPPPAQLGSDRPDATQRVAGHWGRVAEGLVAWMVTTRDLRGRFAPTSLKGLEKLSEWALDWCLKHEPDARAIEQLHDAFVAYLDDPWACDPSRDARVEIWCADNVGLDRWAQERAKALEPARKAS